MWKRSQQANSLRCTNGVRKERLGLASISSFYSPAILPWNCIYFIILLTSNINNFKLTQMRLLTIDPRYKWALISCCYPCASKMTVWPEAQPMERCLASPKAAPALQQLLATARYFRSTANKWQAPSCTHFLTQMCLQKASHRVTFKGWPWGSMVPLAQGKSSPGSSSWQFYIALLFHKDLSPQG